MTDETFDRVMWELRRRGKSQAWLASQLGIERQNVNHWRTRRVPPDKYEAIATVLGRSIDWVAGAVPREHDAPANSSPMARKLAEAFDRITNADAQLTVFVQCLELIQRAADAALAPPTARR